MSTSAYSITHRSIHLSNCLGSLTATNTRESGVQICGTVRTAAQTRPARGGATAVSVLACARAVRRAGARLCAWAGRVCAHVWKNCAPRRICTDNTAHESLRAGGSSVHRVRRRRCVLLEEWRSVRPQHCCGPVPPTPMPRVLTPRPARACVRAGGRAGGRACRPL